MLDESDKAKKREVAQLLLKNYDQHRPKFDPAKGNFSNLKKLNKIVTKK